MISGCTCLFGDRPLSEESRHRKGHEVRRGQSDVEGEAVHEVLRLGEVVKKADDFESALVEEAVAVVAEFPYPQLQRISLHCAADFFHTCAQI